MAQSDLAVAHKDYDVRGGGEILAEHLARTFDAPLYVGHGDPDNQPDGAGLDIRELAPDSRLHYLAARGGLPRSLAHMILWRDAAQNALAGHDVVITSGNEPLWWTPTDDDQTVVAYTHSTPWFQTNRYDEVDGFVGRTAEQVKRWLYESELYEPDLWVANSELVAQRLRRYWRVAKRDIRIVHPPVDVAGLSPDAAPTGDYYLSLSRLDPVKNVDEIIRAANELQVPLKVAGTGDEEGRLRSLAGPTVDMVGWVDGDEKKELFAGARATITACRNEDFGIVAVESLASGTPVIGPHAGFTQYQIQDGKNGLLYSDDGLPATIEQFDERGVEWSDAAMADWAQRNFGIDRFEREMRTAVAEAQQRHHMTPTFEAPSVTPDAEESVDIVEAADD